MSDDDDSNPFGDSSDDEGEDFFHSYKTSTNFHKRENNASSEDDSPPKRARKQAMSATDTALDKLQRRRERNKHLKPLKMADDDDDDSDVEIIAETVTHQAANTTMQATNNTKVDLMDSSDDEQTARRPSFHVHTQTPIVSMQRSGVAKGTCDKIMQARNARFKLQQAQHYHAEDCYVPEPPPAVETINVDTPSIAKSKLTPQQMGPPVSVVLRTTTVINGKQSSFTTTESMSIRQREPFQQLLERYQTKHYIIAAESSIKFSLDGQRMDLSKTPKCYDLEPNDIIDVLVTTLRTNSNHHHTANSATTKPAASTAAQYGPPLTLNMRTVDQQGKTTSDFLSIRLNEPLEHLLKKYTKKRNVSATKRVVFKFDGEIMNMSKTPKSYDMEEEDIIDVVLK